MSDNYHLAKQGRTLAVGFVVLMLIAAVPAISDPLGKGSPRGTEKLITQLTTSPDAETRAEAAKKLGKRGDEQTVDPLVAALEDEDRNVRWEAAAALTQMRGVNIKEPLLAWAQKEMGRVYTASGSTEVVPTAGEDNLGVGKELLEKAVCLAQQFPQAIDQADILDRTARIYSNQGHCARANEILASALPVTVAVKDKRMRSAKIQSLVRAVMGNFAKSGHYDCALQVICVAVPPLRRSNALSTLALKAMVSGDYKQASEILTKAIEAAERAGAEDRTGHLYTMLARSYFETGELDKALDVAKKAKTKEDKVKILTNVAKKYSEAGMVKKAERLLARALPLASKCKVGDPSIYCPPVSVALGFLEIDQPESALKIIEAMDDNAQKLFGLGSVAANLMKTDKVRGQAVLGQAMAVAETLTEERDLVRVHIHQSAQFITCGMEELSLESLIKAREAAERIPDQTFGQPPTHKQSYLRMVALAYTDLGRLEDALDVTASMDDCPGGKAATLCALVKVFIKKDERQAAEKCLEGALEALGNMKEEPMSKLVEKYGGNSFFSAKFDPLQIAVQCFALDMNEKGEGLLKSIMAEATKSSAVKAPAVALIEIVRAFNEADVEMNEQTAALLMAELENG